MNPYKHVLQNIVDMSLIAHPLGNKGTEAIMNELQSSSIVFLMMASPPSISIRYCPSSGAASGRLMGTFALRHAAARLTQSSYILQLHMDRKDLPGITVRIR